MYLICEKCRGYYKLKMGESINDFKSCECGGKLEQFKTCHASMNTFNLDISEIKKEDHDLKSINIYNTDYPNHKHINNGSRHIKGNKNFKNNLKASLNPFFNFAVLFSILSIVLSIFYFDLIPLIINYSLLLALILIMLLYIRYIVQENNDTSYLAKISIFLIIPFLAIFIAIIIYRAINL